MHGRLYVSNISQAATLASLRQLFATCGDVLDVEFAAERGARSPTTAAYVTMALAAGADKAVSALHGRLHCDRVLQISRAADDPDRARAEAAPRARAAKSEVSVAITQQYRDRLGMTYELNCSGKLLVLRFIFPATDGDDWQVQAQVQPAPAVNASGATRERALDALSAAWAEGVSTDTPEIDWPAITPVMRAVRAI